MKIFRKILAVTLAVSLYATAAYAYVPTGPGESTHDAERYASSVDNATIDASLYLDYSNGIEQGVYEWVLSEDGTYYYLAQSANHEAYAYTSANITDDAYQQIMICVPAGYMSDDGSGNISVNDSAVVCGYTAGTAPIVYLNHCYGWNSSLPQFFYEGDVNPIERGYILAAAGVRSRNLPSGKAPTQVVDLKAGIIQIRANDDVIPGDKDHIVSCGMSGGGEMCSILGASGNMTEYFPYLYEAGVLGVSKNGDDYVSVYDDSVYAAQTFSAIADIENADLAYAWLWYDLADVGGNKQVTKAVPEGTLFTEFELALQQDEAEAFVDYINSLGLKDESGNALTLTPTADGNLHNGSYYAILDNLSASLNAQVANGGAIVDRNGNVIEDISSFASADENGVYTVTDFKAYMVATGTSNARNKKIPGFDTLVKDGENNAFGYYGTDAVHYSRTVAQVLKDNLEKYQSLDGYAEHAEDVAEYISILEDTEENLYVRNQTNLMNATEILLGSDGLAAVKPAKHWRIRSGAVDEHTSFTVSYNLALAAGSNSKVESVNYGQMWGVGHSSSEGTSLGTFADWVASLIPPTEG